MDFNRICYKCMREKRNPNEYCSYCGFSNAEYQPKETQLPPMTILKGRYILGAVMGQGGFGITYTGYDATMNAVVAVKELFISKINQRQNGQVLTAPGREKIFQINKDNFLHEAQILASFTDQEKNNIVIVRDYFEEKGTAYIVMEYLDGITLKQYVQNEERLTLEETIELLTPAVRGLSIAHRHNIIHKDCTPDNIMVLNDGRVKLMDFGSAINQAEHMEYEIFSYKKGYAPPEQYSHANGDMGTWTDTYALGASVYYCLTGERIPDANERMAGTPIKPLAAFGIEIPDKSRQALQKSLDLNIANRFRTAPEFLQALTPPPPEPEKVSHTGTILTVLIPVLLLIAASVLGFLVYHSSSNNRKTSEERIKNEDYVFTADTSELEIGDQVAPPMGNYIIASSGNPSLCLTADRIQGTSGGQVALTENSGGTSTFFTLSDHGDGYYTISYQPTGNVIETAGSDAAGESVVQLDSALNNGTSAYRFIYCGEDERGIKVIIENASGTVLAVEDGNLISGTSIVLAKINQESTDKNQIWYLIQQ